MVPNGDADSQTGDAAGPDDSAQPDAPIGDQGTVASHPVRVQQPFLVAPTTAAAFNTFGLDIVPVACLSLPDILFDFDSSFPHLDSGAILAQLPALRAKHKSSKGVLPPVSVFGHADPVGEDEFNKALSGRRARAIYGLLTHDLKIWDQLFNEEWSAKGVLPGVRKLLGSPANEAKDQVFQDFMNQVMPTPLAKSEFLGGGADPKGIADFQGCADFNPLLVLSTGENKAFTKDDRDKANQPDRRVVIFVFRPGPKVNTATWPCPAATEGTAKCRKRFFVGPPPGDQRRKVGPVHKEFKDTKDTFACRFYDRIARLSPCEDPPPPVILGVNPEINFDLTAAALVTAAAPETVSSFAAPSGAVSAAPSALPKRQIVILKKPHTKPARVAVFLKTDTPFTGTGLFTATPADEIHFFTTQTGGVPIPASGLTLRGNKLTAGVNLFAEGSKVSGSFDNVEIRLKLKGGNKKNGPDATAKMTCVDASIQICKRRTDPNVEPAPLSETEKINPGRAIYIQDNQKRGRAKIILNCKPLPKPNTITLQMVLSSPIAKVKIFKFEPVGGVDVLNPITEIVDSKFPAAGRTFFVEGVAPSDKAKDVVLKLSLQSLEDDVDHVNVTVVQAQLDIGRARTSPTVDPVLFSKTDKLNPGRFLMFQNDKKHAARATLLVHQVKPADFAGTLVLRALNNSDKVKIFGVEQAGKEAALTAPVEIQNSKLPAAGKKFFAEGAVLSQALIDTGFQLDVKDVEDQVDIVHCTVISLRLVKVQTSEAPPTGTTFVFKEDDDFAPRLGEKAKVHAIIENNLPGFTGTVRVDFGRLTNRPNNSATPVVNESFTLLARVDQATTAGNPKVEIDWDGKATAAAARELSDRTTKNQNTNAAVHIPMEAVTSGQPVPHGLYVIDQLTLLQGTEVLAIHRPDDVDLSVPILINLTFNASWAGDLQAFGIAPFQADIEKALISFGGRDYQIRDATPTNRMNARFVKNSSLNNVVSLQNEIGGVDAVNGNLGVTPVMPPPPPVDNMYALKDGMGQNIRVFPSTFFFYNNIADIVDQAVFRSIFQHMGVQPAQTVAAPGIATARTVTAGVVEGACTALDKNNVTVSLDVDGIPTVVSTNPAVVPPARAQAIQAALRAFIHFVGNTINHESGHGLGILARKHPSNTLTISGVSVTTPLNGDNGAHNLVTNGTNIMDAGGTRRFPRRIEAAGFPQQRFNATNTQYLRDVIPFDKKDN